jgi:hypothetical protein
MYLNGVTQSVVIDTGTISTTSSVSDGGVIYSAAATTFTLNIASSILNTFTSLTLGSFLYLSGTTTPAATITISSS